MANVTELPFLIRKLQDTGGFYANENLKSLRDAFDAYVAGGGLTVQHNDASPIVRNILDYMDAASAALGIPGLTFTIADDPGNARIKITPVLTAPVNPLLTHDQFTSDTTVTATSAATANTIVTSTSKTYDGVTPVIVTFYSRRVGLVSGGATQNKIVLYRDSTLIADTWGLVDFASGAGVSLLLQYRETPSAGAHTYSARAYVDVGTGAVDGVTSSTRPPGFIRVRYDI